MEELFVFTSMNTMEHKKGWEYLHLAIRTIQSIHPPVRYMKKEGPVSVQSVQNMRT